MLSGAAATASGDNLGATKEAGEPYHAGGEGGASVWWRWVAPASGAVFIDTCESSLDTLLAVYTGTGVNALISVAASDDACETQSAVTFVATAGQLNYIAVDGHAGGTGTITLRLQPGPRPGRYSGRTSQKKRIRFRLSQDGKRITGLRVGLRCRIFGIEPLPFTLRLARVIRVRNGGFEKTVRLRARGVRATFQIRGSFEGDKFRGSVRFRLPLVGCDFGKLGWQAGI